MLHKLKRFIQHSWRGLSAAHYFSSKRLQRLQQGVQASELQHSGEIRICIEGRLPWPCIAQNMTARQRAVDLFSLLRIWDTQHNNGVLIYLLYPERKIEIVTDRGIQEHISEPQWANIMHRMQQAFGKAQFEEGLAQAVEEISSVLRREFPLAAGQESPNELPDQVIFLN